MTGRRLQRRYGLSARERPVASFLADMGSILRKHHGRGLNDLEMAGYGAALLAQTLAKGYGRAAARDFFDALGRAAEQADAPAGEEGPELLQRLLARAASSGRA